MDEGRKDMTRRATEFLVWRAGESVNWECTPQEIAGELGISSDHVTRVCKDNGWKLNYAPNRSYNFNRTEVDTLINKPWLALAGRT